MKRQMSYHHSLPTLFLVPTPIGNFKDMTYRAVETLQQVNVIFSEDTRVTKVLLSHFNITTPLMSYHSFNETIQAKEIIGLLEQNKSVALVSDAGMPCISDPGYLISKNAIEAGFPVVSLPGANAAMTALVASGLPNEAFYFFGFLPSKATQRIKVLKTLSNIKETLIFYEAPHRILFTLKDMYDIFKDREVVIAREISKKFEEYIRGTLKDIVTQLEEIKGEIVLIVAGSTIDDEIEQLNTLSVQDHYQHYIKLNMDPKDAMKQVASDRKQAKSDIYKTIIKNDKS